MNEDYIFYCKTSQAYQIKILSDILSNIIKVACFQLYSGGINLRMMDCNQKILIDLKLEKDNFNFFFYNSSFIEKEILNVGLTLSHMQRQIKSIKKRDSIEIYILKNKPDEISFKLLPKDLTLSRITISSLKIQKIHHINVELPPPYPHSILVNTSEFTKLIKEMSNVSNILFVRGTAFFIKFFSDLAQVFSRKRLLVITQKKMMTETLFTKKSSQLLYLTKCLS